MSGGRLRLADGAGLERQREMTKRTQLGVGEGIGREW